MRYPNNLALAETACRGWARIRANFKVKKFIRCCGPVNARNSIIVAKMHDAGNGVLQVSGGAEYFHSLVGQIKP
jgi:hypothetical protein